jgi:hypothetical protein
MKTGVSLQPAGPGDLTVFIQELTTPVERASVEVTGRLAIAMAMSQGKVAQVVSATIFPATLLLQAPAIDTIVVYAAVAELIRICVYERPGELRRVLGFGHRDTARLVAGHTYRYRITGRFRAEDLTDAIYDVHRVPASTMLPAACSIRDLGLRFQTPVKVVLEPAPSATALR